MRALQHRHRRRLAGGFAEALIPSIPLRRVGEPEDIVGAALYLASEASAYCTGTTIRLDGGIL